MINRDRTREIFGYDTISLKTMSSKKIVYNCESCKKEIITQMCDYSRSKRKMCQPCSLSVTHKDASSGFNSVNYRKKRSEIAVKSNKNRKTKLDNYQKYLPFLDDVKNGKLSFTEIANILGVNDSSVCRFFNKNFNLRSSIKNVSFQEKEVLNYLTEIFGDKVKDNVKYRPGIRGRADYFVEGLGFIEYDGSGFYHFFKKTDTIKDEEFHPIRLNAQAFFGGVDYLKWKLGVGLSGYCSVESVKEYDVKIIDTKISYSSEMLMQCHPLGNCAGSYVFGLFYKDKLIGVAKFGHPTDKNQTGIELRRFFVLDGTPKNTESRFLRQCEKLLGPNIEIVTYTHRHENGTYLRALGYTEIDREILEYDSYLINGKIISKRVMFGIAKRLGLIDKYGTSLSKDLLNGILGGEKIIELSKRKFVKSL